VPLKKLAKKTSKTHSERDGWKFHEVDAKLKKKIDQKAKPVESGKVKACRWKGSIDAL